jgi:putative flippase GtrA
MSSSSPSAGLLLRFLAGGAFNTAFGFGLILALTALGASPLAANVGGYAGGLALSFAVNRGFVFRARGNVAHELPRYLAVFGASYAVNLLVLLVLTGRGVNAYVAQALAVGCYVVLMFFACRAFVFRERD